MPFHRRHEQAKTVAAIVVVLLLLVIRQGGEGGRIAYAFFGVSITRSRSSSRRQSPVVAAFQVPGVPPFGLTATAARRKLQRTMSTKTSVTMIQDGGNINGDDGSENDATSDDGEFMSSLSRAKARNFGRNLMTDLDNPELEQNLRRFSQNAESEFTQALQRASSEFEAVKSERGSEGAIDFFMEKIQEADEEEEEEIKQMMEQLSEEEEENGSFQ